MRKVIDSDSVSDDVMPSGVEVSPVSICLGSSCSGNRTAPSTDKNDLLDVGDIEQTYRAIDEGHAIP